MFYSYRKCTVFCALFFSSILVFLSCSNKKDGADDQSIPQIIELKTGWLYRFGDSPVDTEGRFIWLGDSLNSPQWTSVNSIDELPSSGDKSLWIRTRLPATEATCPALHFSGAREIVQIFLDGRKIHQYGEFISNDKYHFKGWYQNFVRLPDDYGDSILSFRIWSGGAFIGIGAPLSLGPADDILNRLFISNFDEIIFASLFVILGVAIFIIFLFYQRNMLFFGLALFVTGMGVFTGSNSLYLQTVINAPSLFFLMDIFSLLISPVGTLLLIEQVLIAKYKTVIKRLWQIQLIFFLISLATILFLGYQYKDIIYQVFLIIVPITVVITLILTLMSLRKGGPEIKVFLTGIFIFFLFTFLEIGGYYFNRVFELSIFRISWIHVGTLCFVISLLWIVTHRFIETNRQKDEAQKETLKSIIQSERLESQMALKQVESEKFRELDQMKSRFFTNISHEFRTPLTLILGRARQIIDLSGDETVRSKSHQQIKSGNRLLTLINELLDLSRLDAGRMTLNAAEMDVLPLVREVCHAFESHAQQQDIELIVNEEAERVLLYFDHDKMEKIVSNLISNSVKFTPAGGRVDVTVCVGECFELCVADTGSGIDKAHLPHIFDRFYQAGSGFVKDRQGSGIGLALTRELVKLHHGEIFVESEPDKGSVFTVRLPLGRSHLSDEEMTGMPIPHQGEGLEPDELTETGTSLSPEHNKNEAHPLLLIVEDNADMRAYIAEILSSDYQIFEAEDGLAGFEQAAERIPDLIISDVMMPKMDGNELCEKLKSDQRTSHIPVILLTARASIEHKIEGLELGADDYLTKPFDSAELIARTRNLIEQRHRLRERFGTEAVLGSSTHGLNSADQAFLKRAMNCLEQHLDNPDLDVPWFAQELGLSRSQLHRKLYGLTDKSTTEFIRFIRLKRAALLLEQKTASVSEIAYQVGFNNLAYFRKSFRGLYGMVPSEYGRRTT
ncbi:response regulator [bacterium]|nr:response regulator [bacterium]